MSKLIEKESNSAFHFEVCIRLIAKVNARVRKPSKQYLSWPHTLFTGDIKQINRLISSNSLNIVWIYRSECAHFKVTI